MGSKSIEISKRQDIKRYPKRNGVTEKSPKMFCMKCPKQNAFQKVYLGLLFTKKYVKLGKRKNEVDENEGKSDNVEQASKQASKQA